MENKKYYLLDAGKETLGRIASRAAFLLIGKNSTEFKNNVLSNHVVIIINSDKIHLSGTKEQSKQYFSYSGFHGGLKTRNFAKMKVEDSTELLKIAVRGMLPKNRLQKDTLKNLKIFKDASHSFEKETIIVEDK